MPAGFTAGPKWWAGLCERWPELTERRGDVRGCARARAWNRKDVTRWHCMYQALVDHYAYTPEEIWNTDPTSWDPEKSKKGMKASVRARGAPSGTLFAGPCRQSGLGRGVIPTAPSCVSTLFPPLLIPPPPQLVGRRGGDTPRSRGGPRRRGHMHMYAGLAARGRVLPLLFVFAGKDLASASKRLQGVDEGADGVTVRATVTDNGWGNSHTWLAYCQLLVAEKSRRGLKQVLLLVDGERAHFDLASVLLLRANGFRVLAFNSNQSHRKQPCDLVFFPPLKAAVHASFKTDGTVLTEFSLARKVVRCIGSMEAEAQLAGKGSCGASGFARAALWPVNLDAFEQRHFAFADALYAQSASSPDVLAARSMPVLEREAFVAAFSAVDSALSAELTVTLAKETPASSINPSSLCASSDFCMQLELAKLKRKQAERAKTAASQAARTAKRTGGDGKVYKSVADRKAADKSAAKAKMIAATVAAAVEDSAAAAGASADAGVVVLEPPSKKKKVGPR